MPGEQAWAALCLSPRPRALIDSPRVRAVHRAGERIGSRCRNRLRGGLLLEERLVELGYVEPGRYLRHDLRRKAGRYDPGSEGVGRRACLAPRRDSSRCAAPCASAGRRTRSARRPSARAELGPLGFPSLRCGVCFAEVRYKFGTFCQRWLLSPRRRLWRIECVAQAPKATACSSSCATSRRGTCTRRERAG